MSNFNQSINHAAGDAPYVSLKTNESQARTPFITMSRMQVTKFVEIYNNSIAIFENIAYMHIRLCVPVVVVVVVIIV